QREEDAASTERPAGKREGGKRADDELRHHDADHENDRIEEIAGEGGGYPGAIEIMQRQWCRQVEIRRVGRGMECGPQGVEDRQRPDQAEEPTAYGDDRSAHVF